MAVNQRKREAEAPRRSPRAARPEREEEDVVTFNLSKATAKAIDAAVRGLTKPQKDRVMEAIDAVGDEIGTKVGRWVEKNFVRNSNDLLGVLTPILVKDGLWGELRGIWAFLEELGVRVNHARMATIVEKEQGAHMADHYREVAASAASAEAT